MPVKRRQGEISRYPIFTITPAGVVLPSVHLGTPFVYVVQTGLQGHPEFTDKYMEADLKERMATGNLPKEVAEAALRDLKENQVTPEAWRDMQKLLKTFLKVDHERAEVYDVKALRS